MRNKIKVIALLLSFILATPIKSVAYSDSSDSVKQYKATSLVVYVMEGLGATVGFLLPCYTFNGTDWANITEECFSDLVGYHPWLRIGAPIGVACAGGILNQKGSYTGASIGAAIGMIPALLRAAYLFYYSEKGKRLSNWYPLDALGATCGAVVGYNYKTFLKGDLRGVGKLVIGSAIGASAVLLLSLI